MQSCAFDTLNGMQYTRLDARVSLLKIAQSALLAMLLVVASHSMLHAQTGATGAITAIQGKALIERAGKSASAAQANQAVEIGDRVTTGPGSRVIITLNDGTQLGLSESSSLVIADNRVDASGHRAHTEIDLIRGLLHSLVRHTPGNAPNYEVHTPNAVAAARGTDYDTDYAEGENRKRRDGCLKFTDVRVYDGVVEVWNQSAPGNSVKVSKGHKTVVPCGILPDPPAGQPVLAESVLGATLAGGGVLTGVGVGGVFSGHTGGSVDPPPHRPPITASQ
jgi:hypothetical protein